MVIRVNKKNENRRVEGSRAPRRGNSTYKGPEVRACILGLKDSKEAGVVGAAFKEEIIQERRSGS